MVSKWYWGTGDTEQWNAVLTSNNSFNRVEDTYVENANVNVFSTQQEQSLLVDLLDTLYTKFWFNVRFDV